MWVQHHCLLYERLMNTHLSILFHLNRHEEVRRIVWIEHKGIVEHEGQLPPQLNDSEDYLIIAKTIVLDQLQLRLKSTLHSLDLHCFLRLVVSSIDPFCV